MLLLFLRQERLCHSTFLIFIQLLGLGNDMGAGWVMQAPCPCWVTGTPSWWPGTKSTSDTTPSGTRHNRSWPVLQSSSKVYYLCEDLTCIESLSYTRSSKILRKWLAAFNFHFLLFARKQSYMVASQPWPKRFCGPGVVRLGGMRGGERRWREAEQGLWDGGCAVLAARPSLVTHSQWTQTLTLTWWHYRLELTLPQDPRNFSLVHGPISFLAVLELSICGSQEKRRAVVSEQLSSIYSNGPTSSLPLGTTSLMGELLWGLSILNWGMKRW